MRQVLVRKGRVVPAEVPVPAVRDGGVLVRVAASCVSAGSELAAIRDAGGSLVRKALSQPGKLRKAWRLLQAQGPAALAAKAAELDRDKPLGYSAAGVVVGVGAGTRGFAVGDRVAVAGAGYANHAELVDAPEALVCAIPEGLPYADAATVALGAIALQGVRRAAPALGEFAVVYGAGLLGLLATQLLAASGARVLAVDRDPKRLALALELGAEAAIGADGRDPVTEALPRTGGRGADAVLYCAAGSDPAPLSRAFRMCRRKGRVVLLGTAGMELSRDDLYEKELDLLMSTSYGPGRYDADYEERGIDYPYAYVRWTEGRNMAEYLRLLAAGRVRVAPLLSRAFPLHEAEAAYAHLRDPHERPVLVLFDCGEPPGASAAAQVAHDPPPARRMARRASGRIGVALIGAGGFATTTHLPNLAKLADRFETRLLVDRKGERAAAVAREHGARASCDPAEAFADPAVDLVLVCTRHGDHADLALAALAAGKHALVEKPLCTTPEQLERLRGFFASPAPPEGRPLLAVGYNRRFSPCAREARRLLSRRANPCLLRLAMNAGYAPPGSWLHDDGGRIVGEACHHLDLARFLVGHPAVSASCEPLAAPGSAYGPSDNLAFAVRYADGSVAQFAYFACGSPDLPKERIEAHFEGASLLIDDFAKLSGCGVAVPRVAPGKGHLEELLALHETLAGGAPRPPIPVAELLETSALALEFAGLRAAGPEAAEPGGGE